jgi:GNAT superfamily N-acetyltransferase
MTTLLKQKSPKITIRRAQEKDSKGFIDLVRALAKFEHLDPPSDAGKRRLINDTFKRKRLNLLLAFSGDTPVAYALYFFTYSSFLARPTLYLEDLFVLEEYRGMRIGSKLFGKLVGEARRLRCGRMEWAVLTWNHNAIKFYERIGAKRLDQWHYYRLDEAALDDASKRQELI